MITVLDLFSGIGGFSLGLERTGGFRTVAFCEQAEYPRAVLARHWPGVPCFPDIHGVNLDAIRSIGPVPDLVCGGFPCQDISLAGRGGGLTGDRSGLWFEMLRVIEETRPRWVIIENVASLRSRGLDVVLGGDLLTVLRGYQTRHAGTLPTPTAQDWRSGKASAETHARNSRPLNETLAWMCGNQSGRMNRRFVEWMMGYPMGWT